MLHSIDGDMAADERAGRVLDPEVIKSELMKSQTFAKSREN